MNEFSLPKINEDTGEHDHTGKKKSDECSISIKQVTSPMGSPIYNKIDFTPISKDDMDENSPLRSNHTPKDTERLQSR
jgi:hypothetical protein